MNPEELIDLNRATELIAKINSYTDNNIILFLIGLVSFVLILVVADFLRDYFIIKTTKDIHISILCCVITAGLLIMVVYIYFSYPPLEVYQSELDYLYDKWGW